MLYKTDNPHGGDIYGEEIRLDYSANINPFGTPVGVLKAIENELPFIHRYPDPYCRKLVSAIAEHEEVPEEYILCGNGAAELIYSYCGAVTAKSAAEPAPTFSEYSLALEQTGCKVKRYKLKHSRGFELDEGFLDFLKDEEPEAVFLCNPNNPTGRTIDSGLLKKILLFCGENNIRLFIDESFLDLSGRGVTMKSYLRQYPQLFILRAFTKTYGMAGIRLGYCMSSDLELTAKMAKSIQPWNVSLIAQAAGIAALKEEEFLKKTVGLITAERKWLSGELERAGLWVCPSDANFLLIHGPEGLEKELKKLGIAVRNCKNFYGLTDGWYRIAVRCREENEVLINAVRTVLGKR